MSRLNPILIDARPDELRERLKTNGYLVYNFGDPEVLYKEFMESIARMPELQGIKPKFMIGGGYSGLGNSSSFHDIFPREVRKKFQMFMQFLFEDNTDYKFGENTIDRMIYRPIGKRCSGESGHFDTTPYIKRVNGVQCTFGDMILGMGQLFPYRSIFSLCSWENHSLGPRR